LGLTARSHAEYEQASQNTNAQQFEFLSRKNTPQGAKRAGGGNASQGDNQLTREKWKGKQGFVDSCPWGE
jgi:hypothetical protein